MSDQGKANYEGYRAATLSFMPPWDELSYQAKLGYDAGATSVELWLAEHAPADEDAPGNKPAGAAGIGRLVTLAEGFELRYREYRDAAGVNEDLDDSRAQRAIGTAFKKCARQLRDVIADLATPTAQDFDHAAEFLKLRGALERLADPDTPVLGEGLGGGAQEELHVRASYAAHALGRDTCGCTDCLVSLGLDPEDQ